MKTKEVIKRAKRFAKPFRITKGGGFRLKRIDPEDTLDLKSEEKQRAREARAIGVEVLTMLQDMLYAQDRWSVLLIFQAMDAAGKNGVIEHVMSRVNPQGCQAFSFKSPSGEDLDHDYLWRYVKCLPERGRIGIFNRSYYEETLAVRIHPELLGRQKLPREFINDNIWKARFRDICNFERYLARNGTVICKFFLHLSKEEQRRRFLERLGNPDKDWKFSLSDAKERKYWKDYMNVYEETIRRTATQYAPWYVVPADNKWFTQIVVAAAVIDALASLDLAYPKVGSHKLEDLERARQELLGSQADLEPESMAATRIATDFEL
jgi:PPK2 family polyphosphate:nucleotide phosphotransferase